MKITNPIKGIELTFDRIIILRNFLWIFPITAVMSFIYLSINQSQPTQEYNNFLFSFEKKILFIPESAILYWSVLVLVFIIVILIRDRQHFRILMIVNAFSFSTNALIWKLFPVSYPRPMTSETVDGFYSTLIMLDSPFNSFPSGHITLSCLLLWVALSYKPPVKWLMIVIVCIGICTIFTTKQHSFIDALGGAITMLLSVSVFSLLVTVQSLLGTRTK